MDYKNRNDFLTRPKSYDRNTGYGKTPGSHRQYPPKKKLHIAFLIIIDVLLIGVGLCIFSLFHHVLPQYQTAEGVELYRPEETPDIKTSEPSPDKSPDISPKPADTGNKPAETAAADDWSAKFPDKFTSGDVEKTADSYKSANINIKLEKKEKIMDGVKATYYVADIYIRDLKYINNAFANGRYKKGTKNVWEIAKEDMPEGISAILAVSGDNCTGGRTIGAVLRDGKLYREKPYEDILVMYYDGSMRTFTKKQFDINKFKNPKTANEAAYQIWSFGPMLLTGGQPMEKFNCTVNPRNPRSVIGYYEPGHYCFVVVDGRQGEYSEGMSTKELSQLMYELNCKEAYNLDGGESAALVFLDKTVNKPYDDGRPLSDIVYIGE